jgi:hypothetical protein
MDLRRFDPPTRGWIAGASRHRVLSATVGGAFVGNVGSRLVHEARANAANGETGGRCDTTNTHGVRLC